MKSWSVLISLFALTLVLTLIGPSSKAQDLSVPNNSASLAVDQMFSEIGDNLSEYKNKLHNDAERLSERGFELLDKASARFDNEAEKKMQQSRERSEKKHKDGLRAIEKQGQASKNSSSKSTNVSPNNGGNLDSAQLKELWQNRDSKRTEPLPEENGGSRKNRPSANTSSRQGPSRKRAFNNEILNRSLGEISSTPPDYIANDPKLRALYSQYVKVENRRREHISKDAATVSFLEERALEMERANIGPTDLIKSCGKGALGGGITGATTSAGVPIRIALGAIGGCLANVAVDSVGAIATHAQNAKEFDERFKLESENSLARESAKDLEAHQIIEERIHKERVLEKLRAEDRYQSKPRP